MLTPQVRQFRLDAAPILFVGSSIGEVVFCTLEFGSTPSMPAVGEQHGAFWTLAHPPAACHVASFFSKQEAMQVTVVC